MEVNLDRKYKDISIDEALHCKDLVSPDSIEGNFCQNRKCECVWSQYEMRYFFPHIDELKKHEKETRESFIKYIENKKEVSHV